MFTEKIVFYSLASFALAWAWGMVHQDMSEYNAVNLSVLTRLTGALSFYVNLALIVLAFFLFPYPRSVTPIAASFLGLLFSTFIDPLRRNAMSGSSLFLWAFSSACYTWSSGQYGGWLLWLSWAMLACAFILFLGAFVGPSMKSVVERAKSEEDNYSSSLDELNNKLSMEFAARREQYAIEWENERSRFLKEEVPERYLFSEWAPLEFTREAYPLPVDLKDRDFNNALLKSLKYYSVYLDIDLEEPDGGEIYFTYEVAERICATLSAFDTLPPSIDYESFVDTDGELSEEQWVDMVEALERIVSK